jgi:cytoskeletal protein CcmA (bactofilin family)
MLRVYSTRLLADRLRATSIAEAGINQSYDILVTNWDARLPINNGSVLAGNVNNPDASDAFPDTSFAGGNFDVTVTESTNGVVILTSQGSYGSTEESVILNVMNFGSGGPPTAPDPGSPYEYTIFAEDELYIGGNGDMDGKCHGNTEVYCHGNLEINPGPIALSSSIRIYINGNLLVPGSLIAPDVDVNGNNDSGMTITEEAVANIAWTAIDLTDYYNTAVANGQVINGDSSGNKTYNGDKIWTGVPGGVKWINAYNRVYFNGNLTYDCIIVCTGGIRVDGNCNWDDPGTTGGMISRDKYIRIYGNCDVESMLHAPGEILLDGDVRLVGQIISGDDVNINGNIEFVNFAWSGIENGMGSGGAATASIGITAWQK